MNAVGTLIGLTVVITALAAQSLGLAGEGTPSLLATYPLPLVIPALLGVPRFVIALTYGLCFAAWSKQLFYGRSEIPRRSLVLFVICVLLSCVLFIGGWRFGVEYQGRSYVYCSAALASVGVALLIFLFEWNRRSPAFARSALFHFVLFAWLCSYAMPYLGELP